MLKFNFLYPFLRVTATLFAALFLGVAILLLLLSMFIGTTGVGIEDWAHRAFPEDD